MWAHTDCDAFGNKIFTFGTVKDYQDLFGYDFSVSEKRLFFKIKNWTLDALNDLNKD